ncbi:MAG: hypothetical protein J7J91_03270 [Deltaproteobacteria bacterium]|nr:hypothetical protein [Deltaproteobacteria bacterium]
MVDVSTIVRAFRRAGFRCRKTKRHLDEYFCTHKENPNVSVHIDPHNVLINVTCDTSEIDVEDLWILDELEELTGGHVDLFTAAEAELGIKYDAEDYKRAVDVAKIFAEEDLYMRVGWLRGELKTYKKGEYVETKDWLEYLSRKLVAKYLKYTP